jgi:hypothetical protein
MSSFLASSFLAFLFLGFLSRALRVLGDLEALVPAVVDRYAASDCLASRGLFARCDWVFQRYFVGGSMRVVEDKLFKRE